MSAWGIGAITVVRRGSGAQRTSADGTTEASPVASVDTVVTWIPGEVIAFYTAVVAALQPGPLPDGTPSPMEVTWGGWVIICIVGAALLTVLGGWSKTKNLPLKAEREIAVRAVLASIAFLIWSFVVPGSWWYSLDVVANNQSIVPFVAGLGGLVFSLFAEGTVRRLE